MQWKVKRNDLGEAFGTRKAKSQIKAEERNKVDINAMQGVRGDLMESIGGKAVKEEGEFDCIPTWEYTDALRPRPSIRVNPRPQPRDQQPRRGVLPRRHHPPCRVELHQRHPYHPGHRRPGTFRRAAIPPKPVDRGQAPCGSQRSFIDKEEQLVRAASLDTFSADTSRRMLYYLACLLQFYNFAGQLSKTSKSELPAKFPGVPQQVLNGLLTRFAEPQGKQFTVTEKTKTKLLAWICVCYLACDGWSVDISRVARDLSLTPAKVTDMFKSLGCSADLASTAEREKLGVSQADAAKLRRAVLKAPVKFPKIKRRGPTKR